MICKRLSKWVCNILFEWTFCVMNGYHIIYIWQNDIYQVKDISEWLKHLTVFVSRRSFYSNYDDGVSRPLRKFIICVITYLINPLWTFIVVLKTNIREFIQSFGFYSAHSNKFVSSQKKKANWDIVELILTRVNFSA